MAISEQKRQKKLQAKKKKRQQARKSSAGGGVGIGNAAAYAQHPIHECLIPSTLFDDGIGNIIWSRRLPGGQIAISGFVLDCFCLGVKNALFGCVSEGEYEQGFKAGLGRNPSAVLQTLHPSCLRKLIEGAVDYAAELGFSPHRDYHKAKGIFGDVDATACPTSFQYGKDGKPFYIRGPNEGLKEAEQIVAQLDRRCGKDNYDYLIMAEEPFVG